MPSTSRRGSNPRARWAASVVVHFPGDGQDAQLHDGPARRARRDVASLTRSPSAASLDDEAKLHWALGEPVAQLIDEEVGRLRGGLVESVRNFDPASGRNW